MAWPSTPTVVTVSVLEAMAVVAVTALDGLGKDESAVVVGLCAQAMPGASSAITTRQKPSKFDRAPGLAPNIPTAPQTDAVAGPALRTLSAHDALPTARDATAAAHGEIHTDHPDDCNTPTRPTQHSL
jgi:hypothetical protein